MEEKKMNNTYFYYQNNIAANDSLTIGTSITNFFLINPCPNCNGKGCLICNSSGSICKKIENNDTK